jgi:hypothetical protein
LNGTCENFYQMEDIVKEKNRRIQEAFEAGPEQTRGDLSQRRQERREEKRVFESKPGCLRTQTLWPSLQSLRLCEQKRDVKKPALRRSAMILADGEQAGKAQVRGRGSGP